MSKAIIKKFDVDWLNIKNLCRQTISLGDSEKEPNKEWKRKLLIARHSPLRSGTIQWQWETIPFYVMGHYVRHVHAQPFVSTSRSDRTNIPRDERKQTDNVSMQMIANIEELQNIAEKRLCYQADKTTREYMNDLKSEISNHDEDIAWSLVPSCIRNGGCIEEFGDCKFYDNFSSKLTRSELTDVSARYDAYEKFINGELEPTEEFLEKLHEELSAYRNGGHDTYESRKKACEMVEEEIRKQKGNRHAEFIQSRFMKVR